MDEELEKAIGHAMSVESLPEEAGPLELVGERQIGKRLYIYYRDQKGAYWFKNKILTPDGFVSEQEYIFGKKRRKR